MSYGENKESIEENIKTIEMNEDKNMGGEEKQEKVFEEEEEEDYSQQNDDNKVGYEHLKIQ